MPQPPIGIIIQPHFQENGRTIYFEMMVGEYKPKTLFFTSREIQEAIRKAEYEMGREVGHYQYDIDKRRRTYTSMGFYPQGWGPRMSTLTGVGIASLSNIRIERFLESIHPEYRIRTSDEPNGPRQEYLKKRGIRIRKRIPIRKSINRLKKYTITKFQSRIRTNLAQRRRI
jgi:hypothetical protein